MTTNTTLTRAVLAMDVYNLGYHAALAVPGGSIDAIGDVGFQTDSRLIFADNAAQAIGFYAAAMALP